MTPEHPSDPPVRVGRLPRGARFAYTDEGEGEVVVALHGMPGSVRDFRWLAPALDGVRLVRLDQPGFGGTPRRTEPDPGLAARAGFVTAALEVLGVERFVVLGHSMGGPLAMRVAAHARGARGLVLLASVGLHPHRLLRRVGRRPDLPRLLEAPLIGRLLRPTLRRGFIRAGFPASTPDDALLQSMRVASGVSFSEIRAVARAVRCPTLLAWAEDDPVVEAAVGLALANALPAGPRLAFPSGGHNIQKSRATELGRAIVSFANEEREAEESSAIRPGSGASSS